MRYDYKPIGIGATVFSGYAFKSVDLEDVGDIPVIKIANIQNRNIDYKNTQFISSKKINKKHDKYFLEDRDVLIAMTGQGSVGRVGQIRIKNHQKILLNQRVGKFICNPNIIDKQYLYFIIASNIYEDILFNTGIGSGQPNLSPQLIQSIEIPLPPLQEQKVIASILSSLDDKIANNTKINQHLEQMAQAIFKSWFVDFEPSIPFTDVVQVLGGGTPKTEIIEYWNGDIPFFTPKDAIGIYVLNTEKMLSESGLTNCNSRLYPINTVFVTARGTVGKLVLAGRPMAMNQSCYALVGKVGYGQHYVYHLAKNVIESLKHKANGAVFDAIITRDFESEIIPYLTSDQIQQFEEKVTPIYEAVLNNSKENLRLAKLRDTLLPRLISGELSVSDIGEA